MSFVVATEGGLFRLDTDGSRQVLHIGDFRHVVPADEGCVALRADGTLYEVDEESAQEFDSPPVTNPTCILVDEDDVWLGTEDARLFVVRKGELQRLHGFERAPGRETWHTPWGAPPAVRSLDMDDEGTLYVSVHVGGILRSTDGGETWQQTMDIANDVHQVVTVPDYPNTVLAACATGIAITVDAAEEWEFDTEGLHATYCRAVAPAGDYVVAAVSEGPEGGRLGLYRKALDDAIFGRCRKGMPGDWFSGTLETHCLAAWEETVVAGLPDGTVWFSEDYAETWRQLAAALPTIRAIALPDWE